jgi:hypothetical protein
MGWPRQILVGLVFGAMLLLPSLVFAQRSPGESVPVTVGAQPAPEPETSRGLDVTDRRERRQQEFLRDHTDSSGQVRPDLWQQGVEQLKQMKVVPGGRSSPSKGPEK